MSAPDLPGVGAILDAGPNDPVFDSLLVAGPALIVAIAVVGRTPATAALALGYLVAFLAHAASNARR